MDKILIFNPKGDKPVENEIAGHLILEKLAQNRDALTDTLFQLSPAGNTLGVMGGVGRNVKRALVGNEPSPSAADVQAAAELLETPGAADLLLTRAMLDEETMKAREINSKIYGHLFGNG